MAAANVNLLFDLDGTLSDSAVGITRCIRHAMRELGHEPTSEDALERFVGPPLRGTFRTLLATTDDRLVGKAIDLYRERYVTLGMFETEIYPDVARGLERLAGDGRRLWVVTSKPHAYARRIVDHFGLRDRFRGVFGSELDGRNVDKIDLVRDVIAKEGLSPSETWMIGDRAEDVRGGRRNGTHTAGVLWGYGTAEELRAEGPNLLAPSMGVLIEGVSPS